MKIEFQIGDTIMHIRSCYACVVMDKYVVAISPKTDETHYDFRDVNTGFNYFNISQSIMDNDYVLVSNYTGDLLTSKNATYDPNDRANKTVPPVTIKMPLFSSKDTFITFNGEVIKGIDFADIEVNIDVSDGCAHEWVTWTGLFGEVTDCTKCKAKK